MTSTGLPTRALGRTGLEVTRLGYGAMELRGAENRGPDVSEEQAREVLNAVLDAGINFIDTSPDYGVSEERIGKYIGQRRDEFFLASKCGCLATREAREAGPRHVFTRENIVAGVEQSLRRMGTDHLDLVQFHGGPSKAELEEHGAIETLRDLQQQGKVRYIGISSTLPHLADHIEMGVFDEFQIPYSALQREHEATIAAAASAGAGTVIRGGAARGAPSEEKNWAARPIGADRQDPRDLWERAGLDDLLDGMSRMQFLLRFTFSHPDLHTTIIGTSKAAHLGQNLEALKAGPLPSGVYEEAKRRLEAAGSKPAG